MNRTILCLLILFQLLFTSNAFSQTTYNVRSISTGSVSVSSMTDLDALGLNPANIILQKSDSKGKFYFSFLANGGYQTVSDYLSLDFYNDYLAAEDQELDPTEKNDIITKAGNQPSEGIAGVRLLGALLNTGSGTFALSIDETFRGDFVIAKDIYDIALYGNEPNRNYSALGTDIEGYWVRELNLAYANKILPTGKSFYDYIAFGVSVKPQFGINYIKTTRNNLNIYTDNTNRITATDSIVFLYSGLTDDLSFKISADIAGFGLGFDAGATMGIPFQGKNLHLKLGLSIADVGYINWTKNTQQYFYDGNFVVTSLTNKEQRDSLKDYIKETKTPVPSFSQGLPAVVRFGGTLGIYDEKYGTKDNFERVSISADYVQGLSDNLGGSTKPMFGLGVEYNVTRVLSPRAGILVGGPVDFIASIGLGIDTGPVFIDIGTGNISSIFSPQSTTKLSAGFALKYKIN